MGKARSLGEMIGGSLQRRGGKDGQAAKQTESEFDESGFLWVSCTSQRAIFYFLPATNVLHNFFWNRTREENK